MKQFVFQWTNYNQQPAVKPTWIKTQEIVKHKSTLPLKNRRVAWIKKWERSNQLNSSALNWSTPLNHGFSTQSSLRYKSPDYEKNDQYKRGVTTLLPDCLYSRFVGNKTFHTTRQSQQIHGNCNTDGSHLYCNL